jgi:hypothetical protein
MGPGCGSKTRGNVFEPPEPPSLQHNQSVQRDVSKWVAMHENLISTGHSKGLKPSQHGFVILQSLSSAMGDLCINIPSEVLKSDDAVKAILNTVTNLSPDDDVHAQLEIMDKIHTMYRRENQSVVQKQQNHLTVALVSLL